MELHEINESASGQPDGEQPGNGNSVEKGSGYGRPGEGSGETVPPEEQTNDSQPPLSDANEHDGEKDELSQADIQDDIEAFSATNQQHNALETPEGKNNGAISAAFSGQRTNHP